MSKKLWMCVLVFMLSNISLLLAQEENSNILSYQDLINFKQSGMDDKAMIARIEASECVDITEDQFAQLVIEDFSVEVLDAIKAKIGKPSVKTVNKPITVAEIINAHKTGMSEDDLLKLISQRKVPHLELKDLLELKRAGVSVKVIQALKAASTQQKPPVTDKPPVEPPVNNKPPVEPPVINKRPVEPSTDWETYTDSERGLSFIYPKLWKVNYQYQDNSHNYTVQFSGDEKDKSDDAMFLLSFVYLPTMSEMGKDQLEQAAQEIIKHIPTVQVGEPTDSNVLGVYALKYSISGQEEGISMNGNMLVFFMNKRFFMIMYGSSVALSSHYLPVFSQIMDSIKTQDQGEVHDQPKIDIQKTPAGFCMPSQERSQEMVKESLLSFNEAVQSQDFTQFYNSFCGVFKQEYTVERLKNAFQVFIDKKINISPIQGLNAVFTPAPTFDGNKKLLVYEGYYATSPSKVNFKLAYFYEDNTWKLITIIVTVK